MKLLGGLLLSVSMVGCVGVEETSSVEQAARNERADLVQSTRASIAFRGVVPVPAPPNVRPALVELGQALIFDKELSGQRDTSCMTCHPAQFATGDGRHLSMGVSATGSGPDRTGNFAEGEEGRN